VTRTLDRLFGTVRVTMDRSRAIRAGLTGVTVAPKCLFGEGVRFDRPSQIQVGTRCTFERNVWIRALTKEATIAIGEYTFIGRDSEIEANGPLTIGRHCLIGPGVYITDHNHGMALGVPMFRQPTTMSPVSIGHDVWLGARCVILPGVTIGDGAVVAAGAVVTRDVAANAVVAGVPARVLRHRE
jgi:serine acetyltransferase